MASKTSWIRRFPWFMILVLILCAVLTALLVSTVNDARDTTEALLEHFRGIDAVLKLAMEVVRWAVFAEWVMLGLNVFGARRSFASSAWNEISFVRRAQSRTCHIGQFGPIGQSARQTQASVLRAAEHWERPYETCRPELLDVFPPHLDAAEP